MATYRVYTDGSVDETQTGSGSAFVAFTNKSFLSNGYHYYTGSNSAHAETLAIGLACDSILDNEELTLTKEDTVVFYVDCMSALNYMKAQLASNNPVNGKPVLRNAVNKLRQLNEITTVSLRKTKAHKSVFDSNIYVDALAKYAARSRECMLL